MQGASWVVRFINFTTVITRIACPRHANALSPDLPSRLHDLSLPEKCHDQSRHDHRRHSEDEPDGELRCEKLNQFSLFDFCRPLLSRSAFLLAFAFRRSLFPFGFVLFSPSLGFSFFSVSRSISLSSFSRSRDAPTPVPRRLSSTLTCASVERSALVAALSEASTRSCSSRARPLLMRPLLPTVASPSYQFVIP